MTEPDEALLYARQDYAETFRRFKPHISEEILQGKWDGDGGVRLPALGYRAGAAASAEREEELEARIAELEAALKPLAQREIPGEIPSLPDDHGCRYYFTFGEIRRARAALKEPRND